MKVPVYLESTLELLAVVEVNGAYLDALRNQRFVEIAYTGPMSTAPYPGNRPMRDVTTFTAHYARFTRVSYCNSFAETYAMLVSEREHVALWPLHRVWPRQRAKDRYKPTKAERKDKRQFMATHLHELTPDQVRDPLYRKLLQKTP